MFGEDDHGAEAGSEFPDEASVLSEPINVAFIAAVEEDGAGFRWTHPVLVADEVPLPEFGKIGEAEVIESLVKIPGLVSVVLQGFFVVREFAEKSGDPFRGSTWKSSRGFP